MSTELKDRLDTMAAEATHGIELRDPSLPIVLADHRRPPRLVMAAAAGVAIVALLAAGFWVNRDETTTLDLAGRANSRPMPALFYEDPVPLDELPERVRNGFESPRIPPLTDLSPDGPAIEFPGVHIVSTGDFTAAVGLDSTGEVLCFASAVLSDDVGGAGCGTPAGLAHSLTFYSGLSSQSRSWHNYLVLDDVDAVLLYDDVFPVERNIATIERPVDNTIMLRLNDGSVIAADSFPQTPTATGELVTSTGDSLELGAIGCATTTAGVSAELFFVGADGLVTGVVAPSGLWLNGSIGETEIYIIAPDAVVETSVVDGSLVINATWETDQGQGRLSGNCADHHIDLSDLR